MWDVDVVLLMHWELFNRVFKLVVVVWGAFSWNGPLHLQRIQGNLNTVEYIRILKNAILPFHGRPESILQQDNAPAHKSRATMAWFRKHHFDVMEWPARSPDLNPIENVWDILFRRIHARQNPPDSIQTLSNALREEWDAIPQPTIRGIIRSMGRRCRMCCEARGGHIHYLITK